MEIHILPVIIVVIVKIIEIRTQMVPGMVLMLLIVIKSHDGDGGG